MIADADLVAGIRRRAGNRELDVRVMSRGRLGASGGSGAHFEKVVLRIDGRRRDGVLKVNAPDSYSPSYERRFYEDLSGALRVRTPELLASGELEGTPDGWLLLERLPRAKPRSAWTPADALACVGEIARLHAETLDRVRPHEWLPRPLTRDVHRYLAHVPRGVERLQSLQLRWPALRGFASERACEIAAAVAARPEPLVAALEASPQCVIHRDFHPDNVAIGPTGEPTVFDWEGVSVGPAVFDVTLFHQYLGWVGHRVPGLGIEWSRCVPPAVAWPELLDAYQQALSGWGVEARVCQAIAAASDAAFVWESVYRLGWVEHQLDAVAPLLARAQSRVPVLAAIARVRADLGGLEARATLFSDLEERGPRFVYPPSR